MEQSNLVSSANRGYWPDSNPMTAKFELEHNLIQNSIESLNIRVKEFAIQKNKKVDEDLFNIHDELTEGVEFNLPNTGRYFDVYNSKRFSKKIQNWQGIVLSIESEYFTAKLTDLSMGGTYEIGEFGYMENGQSVKRSDLRFQRLITIDSNDFEEIEELVETRLSKIKFI